MDSASVNRDPVESAACCGRAGPPWLALAAFAVAFGCVEAVLVADLRFFLDPQRTQFPLVRLPPELLALERVREAATLVVLAGAASLVRACAAARFATFLFVFGVWDMAYYAALRSLWGWPGSLADWDLLFLLPVPWLGPVFAPLVISAVMVSVAVLTWRSERRGSCFRVRARHVGAAAIGAAACVWSFVGDAHGRALEALPARYPVEFLVVGLLIAALGYADAWRFNRRASASRRRAKAPDRGT